MPDETKDTQSCKFNGAPVAHGEVRSVKDFGDLRCVNGKWKPVSGELQGSSLSTTNGRSCKWKEEPVPHGGTECDETTGQMMICDDGEWKLTEEAC